MMRNYNTYLKCIIFCFLFNCRSFAQENSIVIVVNKDNPYQEFTDKEIKRIFLKKTKYWPNGKPITCVVPLISNKQRKVFAEQYLGKSISVLKNYWQNLIFSGRDLPPLEFKTDAEIVDYIKTDPYAISYINKKSMSADIRVLKIKQE